MEELVTPLLSVNQLYDCIIGFLPFNENVPKFTQCEDVLTKFISNNNQDTLYLIKSIEEKTSRISNDLSDLDMGFKDLDTFVIIIKSKGELRNDIPLTQQLNIMSIPIPQDENHETNDLFEKLRLAVSLGLSPYFDFISTKNEESALATTKKKFNELSLALQHLQQRIHIPDLLITTHPKIKMLIAEKGSEYPDELIDDTEFLNEITSITNNWVRQIQSITRLNHEPSDGDSIMEDIQFWKSMDLALISLNQQINSPEVNLTRELLSKAKRFHITLSFENDIGLKEKLNETKLYNSFLRELPINDLLTITDDDGFQKFDDALANIFSHLKLKLNLLPLERAMKSVEVILNDITEKFQSLLGTYDLMSLSLDKFEELISLCNKELDTIEVNIKFIINLLRELLRKRQEKFKLIKIDQTKLENIKERLLYLRQFRHNHQDLMTGIESVLPQEEQLDLISKLNEAYNKHIISINPVDISHQGKLIWSMNEHAYLEVFHNLNSLLTKKINKFFNNAHTFIDFITIYKNFFIGDNSNSLLLLISDDHKLRTLTIADREIQRLVELNSDHVLETSFSSITWKIQLSAKLKFYRDYLELLLGFNWKSYSVGTKIDTTTNKLLESLDPVTAINKWVDEEVNQNLPSANLGKIFTVSENSHERFDLNINFNFQIFEIYRQLNQLYNLGFSLPSLIILQFKKINQLYPITNIIKDHVQLLNKLFNIDLQEGYGKAFGFLVATQIKKVEEMLKETMNIEWVHLLHAVELHKVNDNDFKSTENLIEHRSMRQLTEFQDSVTQLNLLLIKLKNFSKFMDQCKFLLRTANFEFASIEGHLKTLQLEFNNISLEKVENLEGLADLINLEVQTVLRERLQTQLFIFNIKAMGYNDEQEIEIFELDKYLLEFPVFKHYLSFNDETFVIDPPLNTGKQLAFNQLNHIVSIVETQHIIKPLTSHSQSFSTVAEDENSMKQLNSVFEKIETLYQDAELYISKWQLLQNLWELNLDDPDDFAKLFKADQNVESWFQVVQEIFKYRNVYDLPDPEKAFGNLFVINITKIQHRVAIKFETFQKLLLSKFSKKIDQEANSFNRLLINAKQILEMPLTFHDSTEQLTSGIDSYLKYQNSLQSWNFLLETFQLVQSFLMKHRFKFPNDWLYTEQLENNISMVQALVAKKSLLIDENLEIVTSKIKAEALKVNDSINSLNQNWQSKKPIAGNLNPSVAMMDLDNFQMHFSKLTTYVESMMNISNHLDIHIVPFEDMSLSIDEIKDLKSVWSSVNGLWEELERLKKLKWSDLQPRQLRHQLDDLLNSARNLPMNIRQYSAVDEIQASVKTHLKTHQKISDLKNGSMKPRHWKILLSQLGVPDIKFEDLTVGDVWGLNITLNIQTINAMVEQANSEKTIEENLNNINNNWALITFELFNYENKCRLVKNWEQLIDQCNTDINALTSMKNSPYFGAFEREISELEKKLTQLFIVLDIWIDVQRQWLYLEGVFGNENNDLKSLLPIESSRFTNISYEFLNLLKRIYKFNLVIDIVLITDLQPMMTKCFESLVKVRKSLTDYLEKQRELFPRFYFIGNEDLLELVGGSYDITRINNHLKKMFSGVERLQYAKESSCIVGVVSEQGEELVLHNPVSLIKHTRLHEWLSELELEIKLTLSRLVKDNIKLLRETVFKKDGLVSLIESIPAQVATLLQQITFTSLIENPTTLLSSLHESLSNTIKTLVRAIGSEIEDLTRKKTQYLIIEIIHQRDVVEQLINAENESDRKFIRNIQQRFYYDISNTDLLKSLTIKQANSEFIYGFEYLGIPEKLAYTPLTNDCYLAMCQALSIQQGGSPFGPAGTGKTESIKALGHNLGKMVLVFCCDDSFDFQSMGRIFLGLCKVGIWGCFDEFNRLDDKILSAISSQIESIENGLKNPDMAISVSEKNVKVNPETGIFITMNPGYAGRVELPENLKKMFRSFSMDSPDNEIIVEILLTSQTFVNSKALAKSIVPFFQELASNTSNQLHYDFGLRALKNTLVRCGQAKRKSTNANANESLAFEQELVVQSIVETILPKLIKEDEIVFEKLRNKYFANVVGKVLDKSKLIAALEMYFTKNGVQFDEKFINKALQLIDIQNTHHGIMLVGESGSGKSTILDLIMYALSVVTNVEHTKVLIDAKVLSKDEIYGKLDLVTRDWTDGLFTSVLRKMSENLRGELSKKLWIVFDGDIDPQWAENLNSVLDDNKILTLPNGERLSLPENVRIVFEVDNLKYTTPATISRCGIVWFDVSLISLDAHLHKLVHQLNTYKITNDDMIRDNMLADNLRKSFVEELSNLLSYNVLSGICEVAKQAEHIMEFSFQRAIGSLEVCIKTYLRRLLNFANSNDNETVEIKKYVQKALLLSIMWAFAGDSSYEDRIEFANAMKDKNILWGVEMPHGIVLDYDVSLPDGEWLDWNTSVASVELEPHQVSNPNTIVPTLDTVKHEQFIFSVLNEHSPLLLCGPPGSGKTMTLFEALRKSPQLELLSLNFSKETSPVSLLKALDQYCEYRKTNRGIQLAPRINGKWVVVFCDEINLPQVDKYGNQNVISLIRQMVEHGGFWRVKDNQWVSLENIQFVAACNSPNDPGRNKLSERFLRHVPVIMVDYPGYTSLTQIYQTFNMAILKCAPDLRGFAKAITEASIQVYEKTRKKLNSQIQKHYVYSPRELTRWSRGILEALKSHMYKNLSAFLRLWYHEGLRLFYDRLVTDDDKSWTLQMFKEVAENNFPNINLNATFKEPVFFSNWMSLDYKSVNEQELRSFVSLRLRVFSEEEMEVDLVLHDEMLDHALRIDRVLRQPQGHMILVGPSGSGKSTLAKFVAWINGLKVVQLHVRSNYGIDDFDETLRGILTRCVHGEKICFIIDESSILEASFIERMNTLLANAEIPGLFEGDDYTSLMSKCLELSHAQGLLLDTDAELYDWFTQQISKNLHVVFSISDSVESNSQSVISSPALFNRCVLSWMGDWSDRCLYEVASSRISTVPLDISNYVIPNTFASFLSNRRAKNLRDTIVDTLAFIHRFIPDHKSTLSYRRTPTDFLNLVQMFTDLFNIKHKELEDSQRHITVGLDKLRETVIQVDKLQGMLSEKESILKIKDKEAKEMLNKLLTDQNEAERKQEFSIATQAELAKQEKEIEKRKLVVMKDLEYAEPAVLEAQRGVQNIKKQHLSEIRSMANPPAAVKMTMESVCILLGYDVGTWRDVQLVIRKDDFIPNIVSFNSEELLPVELREYMERVYLTREDYTFEIVHRASKACGPLVQWVQAQLAYSRILQSVGPLREEVELLEQKTLKTKAQLTAIDEMIFELEESIEKYKDSYTELIRETENIKTEMSLVHKKVDRSTALIKNLKVERERWKESVKTFGDKRDKLVGEVLLAAAFIVYGGLYDQKGREILLKTWRNKLKESGIPFDKTLTMSSYLTTSKKALHWTNCGLVNDNINIENFALLEWCQNPVIIDPNGVIVEILSKASSKLVTVTSFLSDGLFNQLENTLRFGGVIIIQDCEYYDPLLDTVLRKEIHRNGGRMMIRLGDQIIDYSSEFKLILASKESGLVLPPSVASRASIINFTVTSGSLENRALDIALKETRPDVEKERTDLVMLNGEWKLRLQTLEEELLDSLSTTPGEILDNDNVMNTLETLKSETDGLNEKLAHSGEVMNRVEEIRSNYSDVAKNLSGIYTIFESLGRLNHFYKFSLTRFVNNFAHLLRVNIKLSPSEFIMELFKDSFARISTSLQYKHKIVLALVLSTAYYMEDIGDLYKTAFMKMLKLIVTDKLPNSISDVFDVCLARRESGWDVEKVLELNQDNLVLQILSDLLLSFGSTKNKEDFVDTFSKISGFLYKDGEAPYSSPYDLNYWINDLGIRTIILTCPEVYDASYKVEQSARQFGKKLAVISMGTKEGIERANKEIEAASMSARWVLIQNIHMAPSWISHFESQLSNLHADSKIFLTCKNTSQVPIGVISQCKVLNFENEVGIQRLVLDTYKSSSMDKRERIERHVLLLLIWYHSVILERVRYSPVSFKKKYDFNDSDYTCGVHIIEKVFESYDGKTETIPWNEIKYLIGTITYGGKVDDKEDLEFLETFAGAIFTERSFDLNFNLIENEFTKENNEVLLLPDTTEEIVSWINKLPYDTPLSWIYLPDDANLLVKRQLGLEIVESVLDLSEDL